jgi:hypothetical protein
MPEQMGVQRFRATNGRVTGVLGLVLCGLVATVLVVAAPPHVAVPAVVACAFAAVLVWLAMLRPGVWAVDGDLYLRTLFETVSIPLGSIETAIVRRYLLVRSGGRKYICPALSRSLRKTMRAETRWQPPQLLSPSAGMERIGDSGSGSDAGPDHDLAYADFVEWRIAQLAADDRARRGIEERSEEEYELGSQVVRRTAWPEIAILAVLAVAFVVAILVF